MPISSFGASQRNVKSSFVSRAQFPQLLHRITNKSSSFGSTIVTWSSHRVRELFQSILNEINTSCETCGSIMLRPRLPAHVIHNWTQFDYAPRIMNSNSFNNINRNGIRHTNSRVRVSQLCSIYSLGLFPSAHHRTTTFPYRWYRNRNSRKASQTEERRKRFMWCFT